MRLACRQLALERETKADRDSGPPGLEPMSSQQFLLAAFLHSLSSRVPSVASAYRTWLQRHLPRAAVSASNSGAEDFGLQTDLRPRSGSKACYRAHSLLRAEYMSFCVRRSNPNPVHAQVQGVRQPGPAGLRYLPLPAVPAQLQRECASRFSVLAWQPALGRAPVCRHPSGRRSRCQRRL